MSAPDTCALKVHLLTGYGVCLLVDCWFAVVKRYAFPMTNPNGSVVILPVISFHESPFQKRSVLSNSIKPLALRFSMRTKNLFERISTTEHTFMILLAIIIGLLAGFGAIGIRALIKEISVLLFPGNGSVLENIVANPWYYRILMPALGGIVAAYGIDILSIKTREKGGEKLTVVPGSDYVIGENDTLVVAGEIKSITFVTNMG